MFRKTITSLVICVMPLASCGRYEEAKLPVPPDEDAFQFNWNKSDGNCCLNQIPHDLTGWTGRVLVKKTRPTEGGHKVELFVVEIAKNLAFVASSDDDPKVRIDVPEAGWYVKFDAERADTSRSSVGELQMLARERFTLVEIKLKSITAPNGRQGYGL